MIDREKEIKYEIYLAKRAILEQKKKLINLKAEQKSLNEGKTRTRKVNKKRK